MEAFSKLKQEVDTSFKELRESLRTECVARSEEDRKLANDASKAAQSFVNELATMQRSAQQQAEFVAGEFERMRWTNTDRADKLSRYVDEKVASGASNPASAHFEADVAALAERISSLKSSLEEQARVVEQRIETSAEDLRGRLKKSEEAWMREATTTRREAERSTSAAEKRFTAAQNELKSRFDSYVKHFDSAIASVQEVVLRPLIDGMDSSTRLAPMTRPTGRNGADVSNHMSPAPPVEAPRLGSGARRSANFKAMEKQLPQVVNVAAEWQNEELRCVVDGLRIHSQPDLASQVDGSLSRGEYVVVKGIITLGNGRRWASLVKGGFVLAFSEGGTPLLHSTSTSTEAAKGFLEEAAIKIQSLQRGRHVRKELLPLRLIKDSQVSKEFSSSQDFSAIHMPTSFSPDAIEAETAAGDGAVASDRDSGLANITAPATEKTTEDAPSAPTMSIAEQPRSSMADVVEQVIEKSNFRSQDITF
jgi:hypothetical protein